MFEILFIAFLTFSGIGWIYETFNEIIVLGVGFHPRAYLIGPWCPVYGIGSLIVLAFFWKLSICEVRVGRVNLSPALVTVGIFALTTAVELVCSYVLQAFSGSFPWTYAGYWGNFEGRIAPEFSLRFTIAGLLGIYLLYPWLRLRISRMGTRARNTLFWTLALLFAGDIVGEFSGVWNLLFR